MNDATGYVIEYQNRERIRLAIICGIILCVLVIAIVLSQTVFANVLERMTTLQATYQFITTQISSITIIGLLFLGFLGGIFFIPLPIEALFLTGLVKGNNILLSVILVFVGFFSAQVLNYVLGAYFSNFARHLISIKQLSKVKRWVNKWGASAVLIINVLPLPSPVLTFALALTRYNMTRLFAFMILGFTIKYGALALLYATFGSIFINLIPFL